MKKRIMSFLLAFVSICLMLPMTPITANAAIYASQTVNGSSLKAGDRIGPGVTIIDDVGVGVTALFLDADTAESYPHPTTGYYVVVKPIFEYGQWGGVLVRPLPARNVTFNANGGSVGTASTTVYSGFQYGSLPTPTRSGYTFDGWYTAASGGSKVTSSTIVSTDANHTLYAHWKGMNYTVKFNANGGSGTMANQSFVLGTAQNLTANAFTYTPKVTFNENGGNAVSDASVAATFGGWEDRSTTTYGGTTYKYTDFDAPGYAIRNNDVFVSGFCNSIYDKNGLLDHYVNHGKNEYANGSTSRAPNTGYIYGYPNGAKVSNLTTAGGTANLYAKWKYGKTTLPTPTKAGYTFQGWKGDLMDIATLTNGMEISDTTRGTIGSNASYAVTENLIPVVGGATYTSNYEVCGLYSFDANGNFIKRESSYATTHTVSSNAAFVRIEVNVSKGISFDQYQSGLTLTYTLPAGTAFPVGGNQTLTAQWQPSTYTITFDAQGGTTSLKSLSVVYGSNQNNRIDVTTNPTKTDYTFLGWFTQPQGGEQVYKTSNGSCYAGEYWSNTWETAGTGAVWHHPGNVTLYAHWAYTGAGIITFDAQGGTTTLKSLAVVYGSNQNNRIDVTTNPTKKGYTFDGWFDAPQGGSRVYKSSNGSCYAGDYWTKAWEIAGTGATWKGPKELTLYAHWIPNTYTVSFHANGGSVGISSKSVTYDSTYGDLPTPTRENHTFVGWFTAAEGGTKVTSTTTVKITAAQTLYAQWNINTYTVTWKNYDGSVLETDTGVAYSSTPSYNGATPQKPEDENFTYTFKGWSPAVSAVTGNAEYIAQFTAVSKRVEPTYTVTIPAAVNEGESFKVSATGVVLNTDQTLTVTLQSDFKLRNEQNIELAFEINGGDIGNDAVVFSITGNGNKNNPLAKDSDPLTAEVTEEVRYSGTYTGSITFTIAVDTAEDTV